MKCFLKQPSKQTHFTVRSCCQELRCCIVLVSCKYLVTLPVSPGVTNNWTFNNFIILVFWNSHITGRFDRALQNYPKAIWITRKTLWLLVLNTWQMLPIYGIFAQCSKACYIPSDVTTYCFKTAEKKKWNAE